MIAADGTRIDWTGPLESDLAADGTTLLTAVPPERWPFGPPDFHEEVCGLRTGGLFCDCKASDASDEEWGEGQWPTTRRENT